MFIIADCARFRTSRQLREYQTDNVRSRDWT